MNKESRRFTGLSLGRLNVWEGLGLLVLILYPLRHVDWGLDLWDTGYNYANFRYFGTEHMDPMWFFSTYLANATGSLLMKLPGAGTLIGMNFYTGLFVSVLAVTGYLFCTRKLGMPKVLAFAGELTAISLCWCPTALLYNYLTYVLFLFSSILLYMGLTGERKACLAAAGALLGTNVLVRFSNLPEAGMILAVWAYDFILWRQERRAGKALGADDKERPEALWKTAEDSEGSRREVGRSAAGRLARPVRHTLWCLAGYLGALAALMGLIHVLYGTGDYVSGIQRLFAMTDKAVDYKPAAMIMGMVGSYVENLYWVVRIGVILAGGMLVCGIFDWLGGRWAGKTGRSFLAIIGRGFCILTGVGMAGWLYYRKFCSLQFASYDSMLRPGILFLMLTLLIAAARIFSFRARAQEKLISGMVILIILLTSLGSNNGIYPSLNNLFLAAPYTFWQSWRFLRHRGNGRLFLYRAHGGGRPLCRREKGGSRPLCRPENGDSRQKPETGGILLSYFPAKALLASFLAMCLFQFAGFGVGFVFAEATGVRNACAYVEGNAVLKNVRMSPEKAQWVGELDSFAEENGLKGQEVILYGSVPALSYYLQMPSAFNPWSDLDSYGYQVMEEELEKLTKEIREENIAKPVVILENMYALYGDGGLSALEAAGASEKVLLKIEGDAKWSILWNFMEELGYERTFRNDKFAVYQ